jgi:hypothetical protein
MSRPVYLTVGSEYPESKTVRSALLFPIIKDPKRFSLQCIEDLKKSGIVFGTYPYGDIVVFIFEYNRTYYTLCWVMKSNKENIAHLYYVKKNELHEFIGKKAMNLYHIVKSNEAKNAKVGRYLEGKIVYFIGDTSDPKAHIVADVCIGRYDTLSGSNKGYKKLDTTHSFRRNINSGVLGNDPYVLPEFHAPMGNQQDLPNDNNNGEPLNLMNDLMANRIRVVGGRSKRTKRTKRTKRYTKRR